MKTQGNTVESAPAPDTAFLQLLQHHRSGNLLTDLSKAVREAVESSQLMGKPAGLTLKIAIKPAGNGSGAVVVVDKLTIKLPEAQPTSSFFYADEAGNLHRNDPNQKELPLRVVESPQATEMRQPQAAAR